MALEALVGSILGELVALAGHSLHGSLGVAWGLKEELKKLERLLAKIKDVLADAEEKQIGNESVRMWLDALKKVAYEAEYVVDQFNYEIQRHKAVQVAAAAGISNMVPGGQVRDFFSSHNQILFRVKMGSKLKNVLKRIEDIELEGREFDFAVSKVQPETTPSPTSSFVVESGVVGRNEDRDKIVTMLINSSSHGSENHIPVLPIFGMGGLGKTTMAQLIFKDPRVEEHFKSCIWVCVSEEWDMTKIVQDLIGSITGEKCKLPTPDLQQRSLGEELSRTRHLIVLDDIWNEDRAHWDTLRGILNCGGGNGSAIIVTTRSERVAEITGTLPIYHLPCLSEDESWTLFSSKSFASGAEKPQELVDIGKEIVRKCGGLPLAIRMLGSSLYMKTDRNDWSAIRDSDVWKLKNSKIIPVLRLSYNHLDSESKRCFAFCATFPKDYLIEKEMLIQMWMAHGFIPSGDSSVIKGREIFNELVQRSFLHDLKQRKRHAWYRPYAPGKHEDDLNDPFIVTSCKMHDLVHDLAQSIVRNECKSLYKSSPEEVAATPKEDVYHLSVSWLRNLDIKEMMKGFKNIRTLMECFDTKKVTGNFPRYTFLRVLLLRSSRLSKFSISTASLQHIRYLQVNSGEIKEIPDTICTLHHLQTLDLSKCYQLQKLPESICTLLNLQTLNLCWCTDLYELPKRMQCMSSLRNLNLDRCYKLRTMPARMGQMTKLETLTMYLVSNEDGRGIQELKGLNLSSKLEIYNLRHVQDAEEARQVNLHAKDLQWLTLCWREVYYELPSDYIDADISYLNQENELKVLEELKPHSNIQILKIWDYNGLKFPAWMTMGCPHLVQLHLGYCTRIHGLPPLWRLNSLELLSLRRLDNLKYIISDKQAFRSLRKLRLCSLRSLEDWWENKAAQEMGICFPSLVDLEIKKCPELTGSMPLLSCLKNLKLAESNKIRLGYFLALPNETSSLRHHLQCLENLSIKYCEEAALTWRDQEEVEMTGFGSCLKEMHIEGCDWMFSSRRSGLWRCITSSLERLRILECHALVDLFGVLQGLKSLRYLCLSVSLNVPEATSTMDACLPPHLEMFELSSWESLTTLMLRCPASLKSLGIWHCPNLVSLTTAAEQSLTALRELLIHRCTKLTSLPVCLLRSLSSLQILEIGGCPELEKKCRSDGEYYHLVSNIPYKDIGSTRAGTQSSAKKSSTTNFTAKFLNFLCHRH